MSTHEAELGLETWEDTLGKLREEASVRTIAKEINAAKTVKTIKILAYKNGEGRMHQGELVCGSSIEGVRWEENKKQMKYNMQLLDILYFLEIFLIHGSLFFNF